MGGTGVPADHLPHGPVDMASGYRRLLVLLKVGIDELLRRGLDRVPAIKPSSTDAALKWGMECPGPRSTWARPSKEASVTGSPAVGAQPRYVGLQVMAGMASTANALLDEFELGPDGPVELEPSPLNGVEGNWLPLDEHATMLVVRHFFYDWDTEVPVHHGHRTGCRAAPSWTGPPAVEPKAAMARQIIALAELLEENLNFFLELLEDRRAQYLSAPRSMGRPWGRRRKTVR